MDIQARAAFVIAQAACANAEIAAMQAENQHRAAIGASPAYTEEHFRAVPDSYQIGWNSVIEYLRN